MTNRAAAVRYARALFDVALKERADLDQIERELADLVALFGSHETLHQVMLHPAVPAPRKRTVMEAIVDRGAVSSMLGKLVVMLAERDRLILLPELLDAYRDRLMEHQQVVRAEVTTAAALPADRAAGVERRLAALTGRRVTMTTRVDPQIIGGVVARLGSLVYDGSIAMQLQKMKDKLERGA